MKTKWQERDVLKKAIRTFFERQNFLEVDTPLSVICPGTEANLRYFETLWVDHHKKEHKVFLRSSPELHMKQVMSQGLDHIFQIGPCFRNDGELSEWHQPEFHMLEWYSSGLSYEGLVQQTEDLLRFTQDVFLEKFKSYKPVLPKNIAKITVKEAFKEFCGIELVDQDQDLARKCIESKIHSVQATDDFETAYFKTLIEVIEPQLEKLGCCFLKDFPPSQAALAAVSNGVACRVECYVGRVELSNGFHELLGEAANRKRFAESNLVRQSNGLANVPGDEDFFKATSTIKKSYSGNALGFDRWLALLCNEASIDKVVPFRSRQPFLADPSF